MVPFEISVIAPCYNEEGNILPLCERVERALGPLGVGFELVCVDDASTDGTAAAIRGARERYPFLQGAYHDRNQGIVGGWQTGYEKGRGRYLVTIDADLQYRPEDIPVLYRRILRGDADLVQGWRQAQPDRTALRLFLSAGLSFLLNLAFGTRLRDNKSGFILYRREVLGDLLRCGKGFQHFQHFITVAAHARGYRIAQEQVLFDRRAWGKSFIQSPLAFSGAVAAEFARAFFRFRVRRNLLRREG